MNRRHRRARESFSLDSFLDLVTNIVGIIIRLILVAWVGARAYDHLPELLKQTELPAIEESEPSVADDPLHLELARQRQELADSEARLAELLHRLVLVKDDEKLTEQQKAALTTRRIALQQQKTALDRAKSTRKQDERKVESTVAELTDRRKRLAEEIKELEKMPPKKVHRYQVPVSRTVQSGEAHFECRHGKVTYVNLEAMIDQIKQTLRHRADQLRNQWEVADLTEPIGAFRMRYVIGRQRDGIDAVLSPAAPNAFANFSYGLSEWQIEAVDPARGESSEQALAKGSEFRRLIDSLAVDKGAVTFWVYPDSFPLYRQLRDHAAERGLTVAGRPLPEGTSISGSPHGQRSRGQ